MYGSSTSLSICIDGIFYEYIQRIEVWQGQLHKTTADWQIKYFKVVVKYVFDNTFMHDLQKLRADGEFNDSNRTHLYLWNMYFLYDCNANF